MRDGAEVLRHDQTQQLRRLRRFAGRGTRPLGDLAKARCPKEGRVPQKGARPFAFLGISKINGGSRAAIDRAGRVLPANGSVVRLDRGPAVTRLRLRLGGSIPSRSCARVFENSIPSQWARSSSRQSHRLLSGRLEVRFLPGPSLIFSTKSGSLAQLSAEQWSFKPQVLGSTPRRPTQRRHGARSSNGRTVVFGAICRGSNPFRAMGHRPIGRIADSDSVDRGSNPRVPRHARCRSGREAQGAGLLNHFTTMCVTRVRISPSP